MSETLIDKKIDDSDYGYEESAMVKGNKVIAEKLKEQEEKYLIEKLKELPKQFDRDEDNMLEKDNIDRNNENILSLMQERSEHPDENYW